MVFMLSIGKFILLVVITVCHQSHSMWMKLQHILIGPWYHCILFCQDLKNKWIYIIYFIVLLRRHSYYHYYIRCYHYNVLWSLMIHNMTDFYSPHKSNDPYQLSLQFKYEQVMSMLLMDNEFKVCVHINVDISKQLVILNPEWAQDYLHMFTMHGYVILLIIWMLL